MGWKEDNRAAIIALSQSGGKAKPEDLFQSLAVIKAASRSTGKTVAEKFFERFSNKFTEKEITTSLGNNYD
jgi:hypothetical protein